MEKLPGIEVKDFFNELDRNKRDDFRAAFKEAWLEGLRCGIVHGDSAIRNLLWDRENKKCYLLDFEIYSYARSGYGWNDTLYVLRNLACNRRGDWSSNSKEAVLLVVCVVVLCSSSLM